MMMDLQNSLLSLIDSHNAILWPALATDFVIRELGLLQNRSSELQNLFFTCNGLSLQWLTIFPISDGSMTAVASIQHANDMGRTTFLGGSPDMLARFLIFAEIGDGIVAAFDRTDSRIWFQEGEDFNQTDLNLLDFIKTCVKEIEELGHVHRFAHAPASSPKVGWFCKPAALIHWPCVHAGWPKR